MDNQQKQPLDLAAIRARLEGKDGPAYWKSMDELAETPEFRKFLDDEFPNRSSLLQVDRRQFFTLMGASLALAGLSGCRYMAQEKLVPFVKAPEELIHGKPLFYATAMPGSGGYGLGLLAEANEGRPTKLEGNPDHPSSLGATDIFAQASVLTLYDPDRLKSVINDGEIASWDAFLAAARPILEAQKASGGAGIRILTEPFSSPTLRSVLEAFFAQFPQAQWHQYESAGQDSARAGARAAFGADVNTLYRFDRAKVIVSLDSDFLTELPGSVRYARDFADGRRVRQGVTDINRLYMAESSPTITGVKADHRIPMRASEIGALALALAGQLGVSGVAGAAVPASVPAAWPTALVGDLNANRGASLVIAGRNQPPYVHALAHAINAALGNIGSTVAYTAPIEARPTDSLASLRELTDALAGGQVEMLLVFGANPVYSAPADIPFAENIGKAKFSAALGLYSDETAARCQWQLPETHYLEAWGDVRAHDGTISLIQPLIQPLYEGRSCIEVVNALNVSMRPGFDLVRGYWLAQQGGGNFARFWETVLHSGKVEGTEAPLQSVSLSPNFLAGLTLPTIAPASKDNLEILFQPDPTIGDGRWANNGWLQELPRPLTKMVWDNAAYLSPATAQELGIASENEVELRYRGKSVRAPAKILPGHPDHAVTVNLGYGRERAGSVGNKRGFRAETLRTSDAPWFGQGLTLVKTGGYYPLVTTQYHFNLNDADLSLGARHDLSHREIVVEGTIREFQAKPSLNLAHASGEAEASAHSPAGNEPHGGAAGAKPDVEKHMSMYPEVVGTWDYSKFNKWGMEIDLTACIGCNACVTACQAENNIPVVGKDQVSMGREMHWIRIDRYHKGSLDNPESSFQPVPCMHCENAPCEPVCPVAATVHSHEGLNQMVYNRCVGTRYCSNNCPYKVRRFNFFNYANHHDIPVLKLLNNPDVTVRGRGVMEKCTFCVQRINHARIEAKKEDRPIRDGEVVTACQQVCPTRAISFGDMNDKSSEIAKAKQEPHNYSLLGELNTQPRTTYLAKVTNPNPELEGK